MHMYTYWEGMVKAQVEAEDDELTFIRIDASAHHKACKTSDVWVDMQLF